MKFVIEDNEIYLIGSESEKVAFVKFPNVECGIVEVTTTYVSDVLRGQGVASKLMIELYEVLKRTNRKAILKCSYAIKWFEKNIDKQDVILY